MIQINNHIRKVKNGYRTKIQPLDHNKLWDIYEKSIPVVFISGLLWGPFSRSEPLILFKRPFSARRSNFTCWFNIELEISSEKMYQPLGACVIATVHSTVERQPPFFFQFFGLFGLLMGNPNGRPSS